MTSTLEFRAFGVPRPQGSKRYVGNGRFVEASDVKPWRTAIANAAFKALSEAKGDTFTDPVVVSAVFFMPRPGTVRRLFPSVAPDLDKLQRACGDALSVDSNILADDSLIVRWEASKVYAPSKELAGVQVFIRLAQEADIPA